MESFSNVCENPPDRAQLEWGEQCKRVLNAMICSTTCFIILAVFAFFVVISANTIIFLSACPLDKERSFLAFQNSSIGHLVTHSLTHPGYFYFWHTKSDPRDQWPLRDFIRVMSRHDLTKKNLPTYIPAHLPPYLHVNLHERTPLRSDPRDLWHLIRVMRRHDLTKTLQELQMLSTVTLDCQVTKIVMNLGSQL